MTNPTAEAIAPKDRVCRTGDQDRCPNIKYDDDAGGMEYELYECSVCGYRYKLYYEDMA